MSGDVSEIDALTDPVNMISFSRSETAKTDFSVSIEEYVSATGRSVTFIAAAYDANDNLVEVRSSRLTPATADQNTISFVGSQNLSKIKKVKTMLWEDISVPRPIVASETFDSPYVSLVDENTTTSCGTKAPAFEPTVHTDDPDRLTDGDKDTRIGRGNGYNAVWIDLGSEKPIDKVSIVFNGFATGDGLCWYVTKEDPTVAMKAGNFTTTWKYLGTLSSTTTGRHDVSTLVNDDELYRYVVVLHPDLYNATSGDRMSGDVSEIDAFTRSLFVD